MNVRIALAAAAVAMFAFGGTAEAGFAKRAAAKPAPAPAAHAHAGCPLRAAMARMHDRVRAAHARPARAERPARVVAAKPAPKKPLK